MSKASGGASMDSRLTEVMLGILDWLTKAETYLSEDQPILGDVDTVNVLIEKHKVFQQEVSSRRALISSLQDSASMDDLTPNLRSQLTQLVAIWERVQELSDVRDTRLGDALDLAEQFNESIEIVREWLPEVEAKLKLHQSTQDDEDSIMQAIENHEKFQEELRGQQPNVDRIRYLAEEILQSCHPNAVRHVKYYLTVTHTRWEQAISRASQRAVKLQDALRNVRETTAQVDEVLSWLNDCHTLLVAKERDSIPEDVTLVDKLVNEHAEFHEELSSKMADVEKLFSKTSSSTSSLSRMTPKSPRSSANTSRSDVNHHGATSPGSHVTMLQRKWQVVWRMSSERQKKLVEMQTRLQEAESVKNFDFDDWRQRYISWTRANKLKYMDFFRRIDKEGTGQVSRQDFINGILATKFPTTAAELGVVFNLFDTNCRGRVNYKQFVDVIMRPDKQFTPKRPGSRPINDVDQIHAEVEDQLTKCQCNSQFAMICVEPGKYKFGDKDKVYQLKLLNGAVSLRFGAGYMKLDEYLANNDPCRGKFVRGMSAKSGALASRRSGSASNLSNLTAASSSTSSRGSPLSRSGLSAKSWSNLSSAGLKVSPSPRDAQSTSSAPRSLSTFKTSTSPAPPPSSMSTSSATPHSLSAFCTLRTTPRRTSPLTTATSTSSTGRHMPPSLSSSTSTSSVTPRNDVRTTTSPRVVSASKSYEDLRQKSWSSYRTSSPAKGPALLATSLFRSSEPHGDDVNV